MYTTPIALYSEKYNIELYSIPKNASQAITKYLEMEWKPVEDIPQNRTIVCVLRDPLDRFISSFLFMRYLYQNYNAKCPVREWAEEIEQEILMGADLSKSFRTYITEFLNNGPIDEHDSFQCDFLDGEKSSKFYKTIPLDTSHRNLGSVNTFIDFANLESSLQQIIGDENFAMPELIHPTDTNDKETLQPILDEHIFDIKEALQKDYLLYNDKIKN